MLGCRPMLLPPVNAALRVGTALGVRWREQTASMTISGT